MKLRGKGIMESSLRQESTQSGGLLEEVPTIVGGLEVFAGMLSATIVAKRPPCS